MNITTLIEELQKYPGNFEVGIFAKSETVEGYTENTVSHIVGNINNPEGIWLVVIKSTNYNKITEGETKCRKLKPYSKKN